MPADRLKTGTRVWKGGSQRFQNVTAATAAGNSSPDGTFTRANSLWTLGLLEKTE
jgi:hypothetical protein